jgi:hypothetical protein
MNLRKTGKGCWALKNPDHHKIEISQTKFMIGGDPGKVKE